MENETKRIIMFDSASSPQNKEQLVDRTQRRKKIAASNDQWSKIAENYATQDSQVQLLETVRNSHELRSPEFPRTPSAARPEYFTDAAIQSEEKKILLGHLKAKQSGYKSQDVAKGWFDESKFVRIEDIVALLSTSRLSCFYCGCWTTLFYEYVRDSKQWSLERLSNDQGHNRDNVVLACLECNMRRRTMYYERYVATKQLRVIKMEPDEEEE